MKNAPIRAQIIVSSMLLVAAGALALLDDGRSQAEPDAVGVREGPAQEKALDRSQVSAKGGTSKPSTPRDADVASKNKKKRADSPDPLIAYRGHGTWVDLFDYGNPGNPGPESIVDESASRGVKTLFVQTSRWNLPSDIHYPAAIDVFIERSHARGMRVVGWYLPGFADIDRDVRASMAAIRYRTPNDHAFDGFAPDIEDKRAVGNNVPVFNGNLVEYSRQLRAAVPPGAILGAIVPDAKNNERAPEFWAGFPWPEMGQFYDVLLPMAYWTVVKPPGCGTQDPIGYMREVASKTRAGIGIERPLHLIGGIADCVTPEEVPAYVAAMKELGSIGGGFYDFETVNRRADRDAVWTELAKLNQP